MNCKPVQVGGEGRGLGGDGQIYFILAEVFLCSPSPLTRSSCSSYTVSSQPGACRGALPGSPPCREPRLPPARAKGPERRWSPSLRPGSNKRSRGPGFTHWSCLVSLSRCLRRRGQSWYLPRLRQTEARRHCCPCTHPLASPAVRPPSNTVEGLLSARRGPGTGF